MSNPYSNCSDEELMVLYQEGDEEAFEIIYQKHKSKVFSYLIKRLGDSFKAQEVFQRTFTKFHKTRSVYNPKYTLLKWIYTITRNELLDYLKSPNRPHEVFEDKDHFTTFKDPLDKIDLQKEPMLAEKEARALALRYYSEEDYSEISKILNTSESNVRKLVSRGLKKLRLKYKGGSK